MSGDPLVCSFDVDKNSSNCACPGCTGQQPNIILPPFYPDSASVFLSKDEAQFLFTRLNKIFKQTGMGMGAPCCCMWILIFLTMLIAPMVIFLPDYLKENYPSFHEEVIKSLENQIKDFQSPVMISVFALGALFLLCPCLCLCCIGCKKYCRKSKITSEIEYWNKIVGMPRGIYFALGGEDGRTGASAEEFWLGLYPRKIQTRSGGHITIDNFNPKLHLYVNPTARREFCNQMGLEFYLPPQYVPVQVPGTVALNMNLVQTGQQPVFQGGYGQDGYAMTNFSAPPAYETKS